MFNFKKRLQTSTRLTSSSSSSLIFKKIRTMSTDIDTSFTSGGRILVYREEDNSNSNSTEENELTLSTCSSHLKQGKLVAFPTETVYGLGANALDTEAVLSIFKAKKRPLTDPVIVHVLDIQRATSLISVSDKLLGVYKFLGENFWPGPLTIVAKANDELIPACVTANTGFVGVRCPQHDLARKLLAHSNLPVAAPSANRFGHVSPTRAQHVMDDLADSEYPIYVLQSSTEKDSACNVGIESTVAKLEQTEEDTIILSVLRRGGISVEQLTKSVETFPDKSITIKVQVTAKDHSVSNNTTQSQSSPGLMLTHYAPDVPAYLLRTDQDNKQQRNVESKVPLSDCVVVDFGSQLKHLSSLVKAYLDLSPSGDINEARSHVFQALRDSEKIENAKLILLPNLMHHTLEHADSLFDRLFRAASGRYADLSDSEIHVLE
jgi:L-threonylcarbamoyladenylate synthase